MRHTQAESTANRDTLTAQARSDVSIHTRTPRTMRHLPTGHMTLAAPAGAPALNPFALDILAKSLVLLWTAVWMPPCLMLLGDVVTHAVGRCSISCCWAMQYNTPAWLPTPAHLR